MVTKKRSFWGITLAFALVLGLMPGAAMSAMAATLADNTTKWSGELSAASDVTMSGSVTLTDDTTLTIAKNATVTLDQKNIDIDSYTLTVTGGGTLIVTAPNRVVGMQSSGGNLIVDGATVKVTGGYEPDFSDGRAGINANVTVKGGTLTTKGGQAGHYGGGAGIIGDVDITGGEVIATGGYGDFGGGTGIIGDVDITDGKVTVTSGGTSREPAGVGINGVVTIDGGTLTVTGGASKNNDGGVGINGDTTVTGGTLTATGGSGYADRHGKGIAEDKTLTLGSGVALELSQNGEIWYTGSSDQRVRFMRTTAPEFSVTLSGGANATVSGGEVKQTGITGEMKTVTYTAKSGYKFPESSDYFKTINGITVARTSDTVVTVSGTPTADTEMTVPDAEEVPVHRHDIKFFERKEATYTEDGYKEHYECTECGKWFADISGSYEYSDEERQKLIIPKLERRNESSSSSDSDSDSGSSGGGSRGKSGSFSTQSLDVNGNVFGGPSAGHQPDSGMPLSDRGGNWGSIANNWSYTKSDGNLARNEWLNLEYNGHTYWYFFDGNSTMQTDWFNYNGATYYFVPDMDGWRGRMATGWHQIGEKWYYFEPTAGAYQGVMYRGAVTPDGHIVGADGAWNGVGTTPESSAQTGTTASVN